MKEYDLIVIGSGPAGEKAAVKAAYFKYKVAMIEQSLEYGGTAIHGGLPAKILKETAYHLSGRMEKQLYGVNEILTSQPTIQRFLQRAFELSNLAAQEVCSNLMNHQVDLYSGIATFEDSNHLRIRAEKEKRIYGKNIIIATGSYSFHPPEIPFDAKRVYDADSILYLSRFPKSICIVGMGVIGCEYTSIFSIMGIKVYIIHSGNTILPAFDQEIVHFFTDQIRNEGVEMLFNRSIKMVEVPPLENEMIEVHLDAGEVLKVDMFLYTAHRKGNIKHLGLEKLGIHITNRDYIIVNEKYQTNIPNIYAVGDVIGPPALANTGMDQGRAAVSYIFNMQDINQLATQTPYGIYSVPEISSLGLTEEQAKDKQLNYLIGYAYLEDIPRGIILGVSGMMKIIFDKDTLKVLGIHIVSPFATELIHYGIAFVQTDKTLLDMSKQLYNFPTLHELYKYAAFDGLSALAGRKLKKSRHIKNKPLA